MTQLTGPQGAARFLDARTTFSSHLTSALTVCWVPRGWDRMGIAGGFPSSTRALRAARSPVWAQRTLRALWSGLGCPLGPKRTGAPLWYNEGLFLQLTGNGDFCLSSLRMHITEKLENEEERKIKFSHSPPPSDGLSCINSAIVGSGEPVWGHFPPPGLPGP